MKKRVIILSSQEDYWEACYLDGKSIDQMHHLGEGYIKELCKTHGLTLDDISEADAEEVDDEKAQECGRFPDLFEDLEGDYSLDLS